MGVKGLWRLLLPIGRRINIETLEGQILAIDASIWMTQFIKAMRDKESGAVRPAAHLIGFFRRLCRLRYHGIRPVFVFDGATPEIKRREILQRRKRRDQFVATHGTAAVQRLAKRLLVEQLKKSKAKPMVGRDQSVKFQATTAAAVGGGDDGGGAFVPGFNLPESEHASAPSGGGGESDNDKGEAKNSEVIDLESEHDNSWFEFRNGEVIFTSGATTASKPKQALSQAALDDENDWDKPIDVDDDEEEDDEEKEEEDVVEYDDVLWSSQNNHRQRKKKKKKQTKMGSSSDEFFDPDHVLSLAPTDRKGAIELAKKRQRMKSRGEFMPVDANAMEYSQVQVRNFLRSSQLNKDIVAMAKRAVKVDSKIRGEGMASDRTRRVIFEKEDETTNAAGNKSDNSSSNSSGSEEDEESDGAGFLRSDERPTNARRMLSKQRQNSLQDIPLRHRFRKVGDDPGQSNSNSKVDSNVEEGEGFFVKANAMEESLGVNGGTRLVKRRAVIDEGDESDESDGGGGFISASSASAAPFFVAAANSNEGGDSEASEEGGGFKSACVVATKPSLSDVSGEGGFVRADSKVPLVAKNGTQSHAVRRVQFYGSDDSSDGGGFGTAPPSDKKARRPKSMRQIPYSARGAKAMAGTLFRSSTDAASDDDDSSQDGGGFLRGKPVTSGARLKSTGLETEVIVIDDNEARSVTIDSRPLSGDSMKAQELQDELFAKALQEEEDAHIAASYAESGFNNMRVKDAAQLDHTAVNEAVTTKDKEIFLGNLEANIGRKQSSGQTISVVADRKTVPPSAMMLAGDDESVEDIDWENGDTFGDESERIDVDLSGEKESSSRNRTAPAKTIAVGFGEDGHLKDSSAGEALLVDSPRLGNERSGEIPAYSERSDDDSDDVDWEGGDNAAINPNNAADIVDNQGNQIAGAQERSAARSLGQQPESGGSDEEKESFDDAAMVVEGSTDARGGASHGIDDFGGHHKADNAAALVQAEATAANLTNWAGRAVRRAIAEHLGAEGASKTPEKPSPEKFQNESDDSEVEVVQRDEPIFEKNGDGFTPKMADEHDLIVNEDHAGEAAEMLQKYENELSQAAKNNVEREIDGVTDEMEEEIMQLLQLFGVPYMRAPAEAEAQCAMLEKLGLVNGIVTEDSDVFVFGGQTIYKNIFDDQKYAEVYKAVDAEREMGLGQNAMVALAMLLGGDYTEGVKGVGIVNGMEIVTSFNVAENLKDGLQRFRTWLDGFEPIVEAKSRMNPGAKARTKEQKFHIKHRTARNRWNAPETFPSDGVISAYVNPVVDKSTVKFSFAVPDLDKMVSFCNKQIGWPAEETKRFLEPVIEKVQSNTRQTRIDSFMRYEDGIKFANVRSKRLRHVLGTVQQEGEVGRDKEDESDVEESPEKAPATKKSKKSNGKPEAAKRLKTKD